MPPIPLSPTLPRSLNEECGVFGISTANNDVARLTYFGIFALQHRGQEAAGIAVSDGREMHIHKGTGLVSQVFDAGSMSELRGDYAIGHTRYSTTGASSLRNAQPFQVETRYGPMALAHNGNLVNADRLRSKLFDRGVALTSTSDSEVMTMMVAGAPGAGWMDRIEHCMTQWVGAYSVVLLTRDGVFAARDPWGLRPLTIGSLPDGGHAVASETGALETIGCVAIREVKPGEVVALHKAALVVRQVVHDVRFRLGEQLARERAVEADVVVPVPDSSIPAALGYAREGGIPYDVGLIKNRYIGRTFIQPSQAMRERGVYLKFNPLPTVLKGKRVVVIDDSIVRGTTSRRLVKMIKEAGAAEVHVRITCPPLAHPCFMGVDMPTHAELIGHRLTVPEICAHIGADSLYYLSLEGMMASVQSESGYCRACFTGAYPFEVGAGKRVLETANI